MLLQVFSNPQVGQVILQAAQGLSSVFLRQAQLTARQREREETQRLALDNAKAKEEQQKIENDRLQAQLELSQRREERFAEAAPLERDLLRERIDFTRAQRLALERGKPARQTQAAIEGSANRVLGNMLASTQGQDELRRLGLEEQSEIDRAINIFGASLDPDTLRIEVGKRRRALEEFLQSDAALALGATGPLSALGKQAEKTRDQLQNELKIAEKTLEWSGQKFRQFGTEGLAAQDTQVSPETLEGLQISQAVKTAENAAMTPLGITLEQRQLILSDVDDGKITSLAARAKNFVTKEDGSVDLSDNGPMQPILLWLQLTKGKEEGIRLGLALVDAIEEIR